MYRFRWKFVGNLRNFTKYLSLLSSNIFAINILVTFCSLHVLVSWKGLVVKVVHMHPAILVPSPRRGRSHRKALPRWGRAPAQLDVLSGDGLLNNWKCATIFFFSSRSEAFRQNILTTHLSFSQMYFWSSLLDWTMFWMWTWGTKFDMVLYLNQNLQWMSKSYESQAAYFLKRG